MLWLVGFRIETMSHYRQYSFVIERRKHFFVSTKVHGLRGSIRPDEIEILVRVPRTRRKNVGHEKIR